MLNLVARVEMEGCLSADVFFIEVRDEGNARVNHEAAERRYVELFGEFKSSYCDQCFDSTYMGIQVLNRKQSRKVYRRWRAGRADPRFYALSVVPPARG